MPAWHKKRDVPATAVYRPGGGAPLKLWTLSLTPDDILCRNPRQAKRDEEIGREGSLARNRRLEPHPAMD